MRIVSDFRDYYDEALNELNTNAEYVRNQNNSLSRRHALSKLKEMCCNVIECTVGKEAGAFETDDVEVYLISNTHKVEERLKVRRDAAVQYYPNKLCTPYYPKEVTGGFTYKIVRVGRRQFSVIYKNNTEVDYEGEVVSIKELESANDKLVDKDGRVFGPIYSVDYIDISGRGDFRALDFNEVQKIGMLKDNLSAEEVLEEFRWFYNIV